MRSAPGIIFLLILMLGFFLSPDVIASEGHHRGEASSRVKDGVITIDKDMFARSDMVLSKVLSVDGKMALPFSAVVWWGGKPWVYTQVDAEGYKRHAVTILSSAPEGLYEVSDLPEDASVVTRGAQLLLSEEFSGGAEEEEHH